MVLVLASASMVKVVEAVIIPREIWAVPILQGHTFSFWPIGIISPVLKRMQILLMKKNKGKKIVKVGRGALSLDPASFKMYYRANR